MGAYRGVRVGITPVVGNDNWAMQSAASEEGKVAEFSWGGEATASTRMAFRVARPGTAGVTPTAGVAQKVHPFSPANLVSFVTAWATQPVLTAGEGLFVQGWNAHGGIGRWVALEEAEKIVLTGAGAAVGELSCRQEQGTGVSSYAVAWQEP